MGAVCLLILCLAQPDLARRVAGERLWYQYLIADFDAAAQSDTVLNTDSDLDDLERAISSTPSMTSAPASATATDIAEYQNADVSENLNTRIKSLSDRIDLLLASLKANPNQAEANQQLASKCLDLFELLQTQSENRLPLQQIRDVDMTKMTGYPLNPGWSTPPGGGLQLVTDFVSDELGRNTQTLGPWHNVNGQPVRSYAAQFIREP